MSLVWMAKPCCMYTYSKSTGIGSLNMLSLLEHLLTSWLRFNRVQPTAMPKKYFKRSFEYTFSRVGYSLFPVPEYNFTIVPTADSSLAFRM
ncbi:hypothetical protein ACFWMS_06850 [Peribacillus butanolivorans]|uniref:hypothetical protein n=1 Tax=Peribacillus butanolivorans TaxID=421767 RepID=UPI00364D5A5E